MNKLKNLGMGGAIIKLASLSENNYSYRQAIRFNGLLALRLYPQERGLKAGLHAYYKKVKNPVRIKVENNKSLEGDFWELEDFWEIIKYMLSTEPEELNKDKPINTASFMYFGKDTELIIKSTEILSMSLQPAKKYGFDVSRIVVNTTFTKKPIHIYNFCDGTRDFETDKILPCLASTNKEDLDGTFLNRKLIEDNYEEIMENKSNIVKAWYDKIFDAYTHKGLGY